MKKIVILLVGAMLVASAFFVAAQAGKIEKLRFGVKGGDCRSIVYMNPSSISAIGTRSFIDTDIGKLSIDPGTKALYDENGSLVATRLKNAEYIPAGFDKNLDGVLRGEEAAAYSRHQFLAFSGNSDVHPSGSVWDAYLGANRKWMPAGIDNPYTPKDESIQDRISDGEMQRICIVSGIGVLLIAGALALWLYWRR